MLTRMVSISSPHDPPASASQSAGITGVSHRARPIFCILTFFFLFLRRSFTLVTQAGVQWRELGSPQPPPPGFRQFSCLSLWSSGITGTCHRAPLIFCIFSRDRVSPCWPGWCQTLDLRLSAHLGLPSAGITSVSH